MLWLTIVYNVDLQTTSFLPKLRLCQFCIFSWNISIRGELTIYFFFFQKIYFRPSSDPLSRAVLDGIEAAGGKPKDYEVVTTPQLHYFVVCQNTKGTKEEYGEASKDGYFKKLSQAFVDFKEMVRFTKHYLTKKINDTYFFQKNYSRGFGIQLFYFFEKLPLDT